LSFVAEVRAPIARGSRLSLQVQERVHPPRLFERERLPVPSSRVRFPYRFSYGSRSASPAGSLSKYRSSYRASTLQTVPPTLRNAVRRRQAPAYRAAPAPFGSAIGRGRR